MKDRKADRESWMLSTTFWPQRRNRFSRWRLLTFLSLCSLLSYPLSVNALGLGSATVHSAIGQPLYVEIPVLDATARYAPEDVKVRQVRGDLAHSLGFELAAEADGYQVVAERRDGRIALRIRSRAPVLDPYISLLIELEWPGGKLYRDYDLLLDLESSSSTGAIHLVPAAPPEQRAAPTRPTQAIPALPGRTLSATSTRKKASRPEKAKLPTASYRVVPGDTLSQIALRLRPDSRLPLPRAIEALYRQNPHAFYNNNIDRLKAGSVLTLPPIFTAAQGKASPPKTEPTAPPPAPEPPAADKLAAESAEAEFIDQRLQDVRTETEQIKAENQMMRAHLARLQGEDRLRQLEQQLLQQNREIERLRQLLQPQQRSNLAANTAAPLTEKTDSGTWFWQLAIAIFAMGLGTAIFLRARRELPARRAESSILPPPAKSTDSKRKGTVIHPGKVENTISANDDHDAIVIPRDDKIAQPQNATVVDVSADNASIERLLTEKDEALEVVDIENTINESMIYAAYGRFEHARAMLEKLLQQHPENAKLLEALDELKQRSNQQEATPL